MIRFTRPGILLRLEGAALVAATAGIYWALDGSWWMFVILLLVPDLSMLGYLRDRRVGAAVYNLVHSATLPLLLGLLAVVSAERLPALVALIWLAHLGLDRGLGLGLKYPTGFKDTHFDRL